MSTLGYLTAVIFVIGAILIVCVFVCVSLRNVLMTWNLKTIK